MCTAPAASDDADIRRIIAHFTVIVVRLQVAVIYFHAAVAKMGVTE